MSAGTIRLTNGSTAVVGTGTAFTSDLKSGDVITATVGGIFFTLFVDAVTSNTALTLTDPFTGPTMSGLAWVAVPQLTLNRITAALAAQTAESVRRVLQENANWQAFYTGTGDITVTLPDGSPAGRPIAGPSWKKITDLINASDLNAIQLLASATQANAAQAAADAISASNSKGAAKTSETNSKTSETNSAASASSAAASLAAAQQLTSVPYEAAPFPDVWAPLNDDLRLEAGFAPYDTLTISGQVLELPSKSLTFSRASTATYIDKSGVLRTAAINEPRFEKEGFLIEEQSTNFLKRSSPTEYDPSIMRYGAGVSVVFKPDGGVEITKTGTTSVWFEQHTGAATYEAANPVSISCNLVVEAGDDVAIAIIRNTSSEGDTTAGVTTAVSGRNTLSVMTAGTTGLYRMALRIQFGASVPVGHKVTLDRMQLEASLTATSYIPTNGNTATRAADDCTLQRSGNDNYFGPVTFAMEVHCNGKTAQDGTTGSRRGIFAYYPSSTEYVFAMLNTSLSGAGKPTFCYASANLSGGATPIDDGSVHNMVFTSDTVSNRISTDNIITNPLAVNRPTPGTINASNQVIYIGRGAGASTSGVRMLNGHIRNFRIWHRALTDNQIRGLR
ncbi:LamG domain-containing protein [Leclercia adecarboxylata]|uniref:LamG domain-containing protein n=1 Tax=Leclercia adecarboxylata TaxID=83655 RepID=UPI0013E08DE5|nr:LamG domain-containing protein [Leclercia adecarboxylata]QIG29944.1 LamG domain-containing protein [Leclercia adecarboxylata]